jgi:ABC-type branched-subunit amino acid transport system ATPase component
MLARNLSYGDQRRLRSRALASEPLALALDDPPPA